MTAFLLAATLALSLPKAIIDAPDQVSPGSLVILDASRSTGKGKRWQCLNEGVTILAVDGGDKCVFASGTPGVYVFMLAIAEGDQVDVAVERIMVGNPPPVPPAPTPTPGPNPPGPLPVPPAPDNVPAGRFGLARPSLEAAQALSVEARAKAPAVDETLAGVVQDVRDGKLPVSMQLFEQTQSRLVGAFGSQKPAWKTWLTAIKAPLKSLATSGKLQATKEDLGDAIEEIRVGVSLVK